MCTLRAAYGNFVDLTGVGGTSATAAEELIRAADLAGRVVERPVAPGQYRYKGTVRQSSAVTTAIVGSAGSRP